MLEVKNVSYTYQSRYQKVEALKDISCRFDEAKFYAIVGQSGSGKTTLLCLLAGLGVPTGGSILFRGQELSQIGLERYRRENVSVVYQAFHLFPTLTVLENVMYPMQIAKQTARDAAARAKELLEQVGIASSQYKSLPFMLSGGEQQRVAIARALSTNAPVLLADEPTGNLDTQNSRVILKLLQDAAKKEQRCLIVVTHDLEIAAQADICYHMTDGTFQDV